MEIQILERKLEKIVARLHALGFLLLNQDIGLTEETEALLGLGGIISDLAEQLDEIVAQINANRSPSQAE